MTGAPDRIEGSVTVVHQIRPESAGPFIEGQRVWINGLMRQANRYIQTPQSPVAFVEMPVDIREAEMTAATSGSDIRAISICYIDRELPVQVDLRIAQTPTGNGSPVLELVQQVNGQVVRVNFDLTTILPGRTSLSHLIDSGDFVVDDQAVEPVDTLHGKWRVHAPHLVKTFHSFFIALLQDDGEFIGNQYVNAVFGPGIERFERIRLSADGGTSLPYVTIHSEAMNVPVILTIHWNDVRRRVQITYFDDTNATGIPIDSGRIEHDDLLKMIAEIQRLALQEESTAQ